MRTMIAVLVIPLLAVFGCSDQHNQQNERNELAKRNEELTKQLASKDLFIEDVTKTINEIHDGLEATWAKEKNVVRRTSRGEGSTLLTPVEMKERILHRISDMDAVIMASRKRVAELQRKLNESATQYAGIQKMVDDLKKDLEDREQAVARLQARVATLETTVQEKTALLAERDDALEVQVLRLNTVYYVVGTKDNLKQKGIITNEGGVLWGLLGSTTVLAPNFAEGEFQSLDKTKKTSIELDGVVDEIIPRRDTSAYTVAQLEKGHTVLKIVDPASFWRDRHLVIVTE